jgi:hypothetical protein
MIELSPTAVEAGALVGAAPNVSAPGADGGALEACAAVAGKNAATVPTIAEAKRWRLPIGECIADIILLLNWKLNRKTKLSEPT